MHPTLSFHTHRADCAILVQNWFLESQNLGEYALADVRGCRKKYGNMCSLPYKYYVVHLTEMDTPKRQKNSLNIYKDVLATLCGTSHI